MADRLTQLQDSVDQIATQFFSALRYVATHHGAAPMGNEAKVLDEGRSVDPPEVFECTFERSEDCLPFPVLELTLNIFDLSTAAMSELARDLIVKSKQIELLITGLPGIGVSEDEQQARLRSLEAQLKEAERERVRSVQEKELARERLEGVIVNLRRI
jgi:mediator of RNA polymerase II transcription subunit 21